MTRNKEVTHPENLRCGQTYQVTYVRNDDDKLHKRTAEFIEMCLVIGSRELTIIFERDDCLISIPWKNITRIVRIT